MSPVSGRQEEAAQCEAGDRMWVKAQSQFRRDVCERPLADRSEVLL